MSKAPTIAGLTLEQWSKTVNALEKKLNLRGHTFIRYADPALNELAAEAHRLGFAGIIRRTTRRHTRT